jgi:cytochrome c
MTQPQPPRGPYDDEDDTPPQRPRWLGAAIIVFMVLIALGVFNLGFRMFQDARAKEAAEAASANAQPALITAKALVESSDCMRCHGVERRFVGPSFGQIAGRYAPRPDAQAYLARKIREGSVGEWGRTIMPRHPQINEAQALQMAQWVLSVPPVAPVATTPAAQ